MTAPKRASDCRQIGPKPSVASALMVKRRSRVLRRRTRQAALDTPRVHDGQLGFCCTKALKSETTEKARLDDSEAIEGVQENMH